MPRMQKMIEKRCSKFLDPGETVESAVLASSKGLNATRPLGREFGVLSTRWDEKKNLTGADKKPYGTALLISGREAYMSMTSTGDLVAWKRGFIGTFTGIAARIPAAGIRSMTVYRGTLITRIVFHFSDGSVGRLAIHAGRECDTFTECLQRNGVVNLAP